MQQKPVTAGGIEKLDHYDKQFETSLEKLFLRLGLSRTGFAEFLGVSYVTYCNWRNGRYEKVNDFPKNSIGAYLRLSDEDLQELVAERNVE
jgi:DNA-binding XRE family transcriptional regulator